jgi:DNA-3-methyladenine glycosylase I
MTEVRRCAWAESDPLLQTYHDEEWGVPLHDSRALWELLMLEGFQAGLSWLIVLRKREAFRQAFKGFEPERVARFGVRDIDRLLKDTGIIRSRAKIEATIAGAKIFEEMKRKGEDFAGFAWDQTGGKPIRNATGHPIVSTPLSERISAELKKRGFKFVGPVIVYSWMQASGMVNDHDPRCFRAKEVANQRA